MTEGPKWFDRERALLAIDALVAQAMTVRMIVENIEIGVDPSAPARCPLSESGRHERMHWDEPGLVGMCRDCGEPIDLRPDSGVSAAEGDAPGS